MQVVADIIDFVNDGVVRPELALSHELLGHLELRIVSIHLLGWLKSQHRMQTKRPLDIRQGYPWQNNLRKWLQEDTRLAMLFIADECSYDFDADLAEGARSVIRALVNEGYHPPLRT